MLEWSEFSYKTLTICKNSLIYCGTFPGSLNCTCFQILTSNKTNIVGKTNNDKANYKPRSIFPLLSMFYDKLLFNQLSEYANKFLSRILYGFRKAHITEHALLTG